jgi:hypothetical protein
MDQCCGERVPHTGGGDGNTYVHACPTSQPFQETQNAYLKRLVLIVIINTCPITITMTHSQPLVAAAGLVVMQQQRLRTDSLARLCPGAGTLRPGPVTGGWYGGGYPRPTHGMM